MQHTCVSRTLMTEPVNNIAGCAASNRIDCCFVKITLSTLLHRLSRLAGLLFHYPPTIPTRMEHTLTAKIQSRNHNTVRAVYKPHHCSILLPLLSAHCLCCLFCQLIASEENLRVLSNTKRHTTYNANSAAAADSTTAAATLAGPATPAVLLAAGAAAAAAAAGADALASAGPAVAATAPGTAAVAAVALAALGAPAQVEAGHFASALIGIVILASWNAPEEPVADVANSATDVAAKDVIEQSKRQQQQQQAIHVGC
jgi:hypothetical protein